MINQFLPEWMDRHSQKACAELVFGGPRSHVDPYSDTPPSQLLSLQKANLDHSEKWRGECRESVRGLGFCVFFPVVPMPWVEFVQFVLTFFLAAGMA